MKVQRSYLFVPAKDFSIVKKAILSDSDSVIIDLEDAVAQSEKEKARNLAKQALVAFSRLKPIYIRINDLSTEYWEEDAAVAVRNGAKGVMVPKSETKGDMRKIGDKVRTVFKEIGKNADFEVIPLLETAKGIQFAFDLAGADPLVTRLSFGSIDFSLDIGCERTSSGEELLFARSAIVIASRAAGIEGPIDSVYPDLNNLEGLKNETKLAKQLGFKGKMLIHPKQIESVHEVFAPHPKQLQEAREIVEEFQKAEKQGMAAISIHNQLVDYPVYKKAKQLLEQYETFHQEKK